MVNTSWFQDGDFVGQYGVETSSLKPIGANPQDDFNAVAATTLQLLRTQIINAFGAISRLIIGCDNVKRPWNVKKIEYQYLRASDEMRFLTDGGNNPWVIENIAVDEATIEDIVR
ncbi:unnamed protein product [Arctia plantaginis]|uniref:Uncharacterized protein n=1 Tax=Arctia plantaginis TaxID=874455 RepID=A0A8S0ZVH9_ARCPL|nr:unnamed protein product [Arctia plantaginis]